MKRTPQRRPSASAPAQRWPLEDDLGEIVGGPELDEEFGSEERDQTLVAPIEEAFDLSEGPDQQDPQVDDLRETLVDDLRETLVDDLRETQVDDLRETLVDDLREPAAEEAKSCPTCGTLCDADARFCGICGAPLAPAAEKDTRRG